MKKISIIAALSQNRVIGQNNTLPWYLPEDLQHFKLLTLNKAIIMGRKTFESLGRPLPKRFNIIVTHNHDFTADQCYVSHSLDEAIKQAQSLSHEEIMIIGGSEIFKQALPLATHLYLTFIEKIFEGDSFFPEFNLSQWKKISEEKHLKENLEDESLAYRYVEYEKL